MDKTNEKLCYFTIFFYLCIEKKRWDDTVCRNEKKR